MDQECEYWPVPVDIVDSWQDQDKWMTCVYHQHGLTSLVILESDHSLDSVRVYNQMYDRQFFDADNTQLSVRRSYECFPDRYLFLLSCANKYPSLVSKAQELHNDLLKSIAVLLDMDTSKECILPVITSPPDFPHIDPDEYQPVDNNPTNNKKLKWVFYGVPQFELNILDEYIHCGKYTKVICDGVSPNQWYFLSTSAYFPFDTWDGGQIDTVPSGGIMRPFPRERITWLKHLAGAVDELTAYVANATLDLEYVTSVIEHIHGYSALA